MERWAGILQPFFLEVFTNFGCRIRGWTPGKTALLRVGKAANLLLLVAIGWQNRRLERLRSQWKSEAVIFTHKKTVNLQSHMMFEAKLLNRKSQKYKQTSCLDMLRKYELMFRSHQQMRSWWILQALNWNSWFTGVTTNCLPKRQSSFDSAQHDWISSKGMSDIWRKKTSPWRKNTTGCSTIFTYNIEDSTKNY